MDTLLAELRIIFRGLARRPAFTALVVLTFGLGIGASTSIFSVVDGVLLRELPYPEPDRLLRVRTHFRGSVSNASAAANFLDYREQLASLEAVTLYQPGRWLLGETADPQFLSGALASHEFFATIGVQPVLGRGFVPGDERPDADVVVISYGLWQGRFGGRPDVVGQRLSLDSRPVSVIGVMPQGFAFPFNGSEVWRPLWIDVSAQGLRSDHVYQVVARVADGVPLRRAQSEFAAYGERVVERYPENYETFEYGVSAVSLRESIVGSSRTPILVLAAAVLFVLLIAVANVANLLLVRSESRAHELSIRTALGASRARLSRQLLAECLVLSSGGGVVGLVLAVFGTDALLALARGAVPRADNVQIDLRVLVAATVVSVVAGLLAGILPVIGLSGRQPGQALQAGARSIVPGGQSRLRQGLVIAEVGLAVTLAVGAGLMIRTLSELDRVDVGFRTDSVLTTRIMLPPSAYPDGPRIAEYFRRLQEQVQALPDVVSAGIARQLPLASGFGTYAFRIQGGEADIVGEAPHSYYQLASPGYFAALGLLPIRGRLFDATDVAGRSPVAVVNEAFVRRLLDGESPLGRRVRRWSLADPQPWIEIVGVVPDILQRDLEREPYPTLYVNHAQILTHEVAADSYDISFAGSMALVVQARNDAAALTGPIRDILRGLDAQVPLGSFRTMADVRAATTADRQFPAVLLMVFGSLALALATVGVYGVVAFAASRRTHEIGIRMALGAVATDVRRLVVWHGLGPVLLGVLLGLGGTAALSGTLRSLLFNVRPVDPLTLFVVPAVIVGAALLASSIPALRAARLDPARVLRDE